MSDVRLFKRSDVVFEPFGDPPGKATLGRVVGPDISRTLGGGLATFSDGCSIERTLVYDEIIFVQEGRFRLRVGDDLFEGDPGDIVWIPRGTTLKYEGDEAAVFYSLAPVNWREIPDGERMANDTEDRKAEPP
jgi:ethanolamine utilization protein EutQ